MKTWSWAITKTRTSRKGISLIELMIVVAIISILALMAELGFAGAREKVRMVAALATAKSMAKALTLYQNTNGFYPPQVPPGWDPGLAKPLPYNPQNSAQDCNTAHGSCVCGALLLCITLPPDIPPSWLNQVLDIGMGPYLDHWPTKNPWGGAYQYNYWPKASFHNGCFVPAGVYIGIGSQNAGVFDLDPNVERRFFNKGLDDDGCPNNGEVQILVSKL